MKKNKATMGSRGGRTYDEVLVYQRNYYAARREAKLAMYKVPDPKDRVNLAKKIVAADPLARWKHLPELWKQRGAQDANI